MIAAMAMVLESVSVFLFSFGVNIIPFASPSNLLIASNAAMLINSDPLSIGVLVALGATSAKLIHYVISFFIGKRASEKYEKRLKNAASKMHPWAPLAIFIASATPIPDDPVIVPLGLIKYNPAVFASAYFAGKLSICTLGAPLGIFGDQFLSGFVDQVIPVIISLLLTTAITVVLLKVNLSTLEKRLLKKLGWIKIGK